MQHQPIRLIAIRIVGYANFFALICILFNVKSNDGNLFILLMPPLLALIGTVFYFAFWSRIFPSIDKKIGREIMSPYILATTLMFLAIILIVGLGMYGSYHQISSKTPLHSKNFE